MRTQRWFLVGMVAVMVAAGLLLGAQRRMTALLRGQVVQEKTLMAERTRLETEHQRLLTIQVSPEELQRLRAERAAVTGLIAEIEAMKRRAETAVRPSAAPVAGPASARETTSAMKAGAIPARGWKNAGQTTPEAAFETALWASAGGDVDALTGLISLDAGARTKAQEIFARLPASLQQEMVTPERLVALLTARDVPLGSAQILGQYETPLETKLSAQLLDPEGNSKEVLFSLRDENEHWRLVVPGSAVEKYAAWLQTPAAKK